MKLPKHIQDAIRKAGKASVISRDNNEIVRNWLEKHNDANQMYWEDYLIDSIELGNSDGSESLIKFLENDCKLLEE